MRSAEDVGGDPVVPGVGLGVRTRSQAIILIGRADE